MGDARRMELHNARGLLKTSWLMVTIFWIGWVLGDRVANALFGIVAFFALREFITLSPTRRGDRLAWCWPFCGAARPVLAGRHAALRPVYRVHPVYVFLALPVVSVLADDPQRFLERNAKLCSGASWCVSMA